MTLPAHVVFCSDQYISRIYTQNQQLYLAHYIPTQAEPFKTSLLQSQNDAEKQHKNFVFFYQFQRSYQPRPQREVKLEQAIQHLMDADTITDPVTGQKWLNKQLQLAQHLPDLTILPDCDFQYSDERWIGTEKCHTTIYEYQIRSGQIHLISEDTNTF